jgi:hypothetical protein
MPELLRPYLVSPRAGQAAGGSAVRRAMARLRQGVRAARVLARRRAGDHRPRDARKPLDPRVRGGRRPATWSRLCRMANASPRIAPRRKPPLAAAAWSNARKKGMPFTRRGRSTPPPSDRRRRPACLALRRAPRGREPQVRPSMQPRDRCLHAKGREGEDGIAGEARDHAGAEKGRLAGARAAEAEEAVRRPCAAGVADGLQRVVELLFTAGEQRRGGRRSGSRPG